MMLGDEINKVDYSVRPEDIPDSNEGNLRLYYELELLRSGYEINKREDSLKRYATIIDELGNRGLFIDFSSELSIDKMMLKLDWDELISKPFADYKDFADCVARNQDKDDPVAYCAAIKHRVEGKEA